MAFFEKLKSFFSSSSTNETNTTTNKNRPDQDGEEGVLRYFNRSRGYGFIHRAESNEKIFVHVSDLKDRVRVGDSVRFETESTEKGPRARGVKIYP